MTAKEIALATGVKSNMIQYAPATPQMAPILRLRGWRRVTRREVGLPGKGWCLVRPDESSIAV